MADAPELLIHISGNALADVREISRLRGDNPSVGDVVARALGTELVVLRIAGAADHIWVRPLRSPYRQKVTLR